MLAKHDSGRLPKNIKPINYLIELWPRLDDSKYEGKVIIDIEILATTDEVLFHAQDIQIKSTTIKVEDSADESTSDVKYDADQDINTAKFKTRLLKGAKAKLVISFTASLTEGTSGFYRANYLHDGVTKTMLSTHMEPLDCRKVFPCFDEPAFKATFDITLTVDSHLTCLSNMNVIEETPAGAGKKTVQFARSPLMSTYLVAFVVGELNYIESSDFHVPVRVYTVPGKEEHGRYALDLGVKTLSFFEKLFGVPYPLPKLDQVVVANFNGAMENWGLVLFTESCLLLDEKTSSASDEKRVSEVVQHELAHQWFGNLVTMEYWDGLWLNDKSSGFATWMSWYSSSSFNPDWSIWETFVAETQSAALKFDSLRNSHAVELKITKISDIDQIFNPISYCKGPSIIRMISHAIGEDVFIRGIAAYMKKHAYGNTITKDLWDALNEASGIDVSKIMHVWTTVVGFPVITVMETSSGIELQQNRYLQSADATLDEDSILYPVLIDVATVDGIKQVFLEERSVHLSLSDTTFYKLNAGQAGLYRTLYPTERLPKLGRAMSEGKLPAVDRIGILLDTAALSISGHQKTSGLLALLEPLAVEENHNVWSAISTTVAEIRQLFKFEEVGLQNALARFERDLVGPMVEKLGWDIKPTDDLSTQELKELLFWKAGLAGNETVVKVAKQMYMAFKADNKDAFSAGLRKAVYAIALQDGSQEDFDFMFMIYRTAGSADEREDALRGLFSMRNPLMVQQALNLVLSNTVKSSDIRLALLAYLNTGPTVQELWKFGSSHFNELEKKVGATLGMFGAVVGILCRGFTKRDQISEVNEFFDRRDTTKFDRQLAQTRDRMEVNAKWLERDKEDVRSWLVEKGYFVQST